MYQEALGPLSKADKDMGIWERLPKLLSALPGRTGVVFFGDIAEYKANGPQEIL